MIDTVIYESKSPLNPQQRFCAFLVHEAFEVKDKKRTGNKIKEQLPMVFWAETHDEVDRRARQWWADETAKAEAKKERGSRLGKLRGEQE